MAETIPAPGEEEIPLPGDEGVELPPKSEVVPLEGAEPPEGAEEPPPPEDEGVAPEDIPVRGSAAHIIARKNKQLEKLRSKVDPDEDPEIPEDLYQDPVDKKISEKISPLVDAIAKRADEDEVAELFKDEPEAKKLEKSIRAYMDHPAWSAVPPKAIYHHLAFSQAAKVGAQKKALADEEAGAMRGGGSSRRQAPRATGNIPSAEEIANMSDEDFEKLQDKVNQGEYKTD